MGILASGSAFSRDLGLIRYRGGCTTYTLIAPRMLLCLAFENGNMRRAAEQGLGGWPDVMEI